MDSTDLPQPMLPARVTQARSPGLVAVEGERREAGAPPLNVRVALRAFQRHWWAIGLAWTVLTAVLAVVIHVQIKPSYEATSVLRVEPSSRDLFSLGLHSADSLESFLKTQVEMITSPNVLEAAATNPRAANQPAITAAEDVDRELKELLQVSVVPGTYLIKVSMGSASAVEAAAVVNAVVDAYLKTVAQFDDGMTRDHILKLETYQRELQDQAREKENAWLALAAQGNVDPPTRAPDQGADALLRPTRSGVTLEQYKKAKDELFKINIELVEAESLLGSLRNQGQDAGAKPLPDRQVARLFRADPEVAKVIEQIEQVRLRIDAATRLVRSERDPSLLANRQKLAALKGRYERLWEVKSPEIRESLELVKDKDGSELTVAGVTQRIGALKASKAGYEKMLSTIEVLNQQEGSDAVKVVLLRQALDDLKSMQLAVTKRLEQLRFEAKGNARINCISTARIPTKPVNSKRRKLLAATPFGMMFVVLGLAVVLEVKARRISDPDELPFPTRIAEVFALPPLPVPRKLGWLRRSDDHGERFEAYIQGLDHLRVALAGETSVERGRCVLITSAVGGEGKTTLAAQLATRCANSGMSTLLIDADLRRGSLSRLFNVPDDLGLSDVLLGDVTAEAVILTLENFPFRLLPAGTPGADLGRVLQGREIGPLMARLRQAFEIIIVDSPPVLPVPDALTLGPWTDGVVLVSRYDMSRIPLIERARQRLDSAGIPVLGTVVNEVRPTQSYAQRYAYGRQSEHPSESNPT